VAQLKYLGGIIADQNYIQEEIQSGAIRRLLATIPFRTVSILTGYLEI
jgi:hypothetical protein